MRFKLLIAAIIILVIIYIWKKVTVKIVKGILCVIAAVFVFVIIAALVTGKENMLPGGSRFEKCFYDGTKTDFFCTEHQQWECESCHKANK